MPDLVLTLSSSSETFSSSLSRKLCSFNKPSTKAWIPSSLMGLPFKLQAPTSMWRTIIDQYDKGTKYGLELSTALSHFCPNGQTLTWIRSTGDRFLWVRFALRGTHQVWISFIHNWWFRENSFMRVDWSAEHVRDQTTHVNRSLIRLPRHNDTTCNINYIYTQANQNITNSNLHIWSTSSC